MPKQLPEIITIDLHYLGIPQSIAAYVVWAPQGPVLIESGPASTLEHLERGVKALGLQLGDIRHALVTHIHLDHAGAAGHLARNGTQIYVHEFGAKHLVDPSKLIESATRIYGEQMDRLWGRLVSVPQKQITAVHDGDVIEVCGIRLEAIETPGHAKHHHAFALDDVCFVGDIAGITLPTSIVPEPPAGDFIALPSPPPEFDLEAWMSSVDRLADREFRVIYPTHFGERRNAAAHLKRLKEVIPQHAEFVRAGLAANHSRDRILQEYIEWNRADARSAGVNDRDFARYVSANLLTMNVDGIVRYWSKRKSAGETAAK